ncbi:unnamed protein product, partial [Prunus brigantina]
LLHGYFGKNHHGKKMKTCTRKAELAVEAYEPTNVTKTIFLPLSLQEFLDALRPPSYVF